MAQSFRNHHHVLIIHTRHLDEIHHGSIIHDERRVLAVRIRLEMIIIMIEEMQILGVLSKSMNDLRSSIDKKQARY